MNIDFTRLKVVLSSAEAKTKKAKDSAQCMSEFTAFISNYIEKCLQFTQEELAFIIISMQNWIIRKDYTYSRDEVKAGDIFFADLGIGYKPEFAYTHPVIILERIGKYVLVMPTSTSAKTVKEAYHPDDNQAGNRFFRKVGVDDGFQEECAIIISNIRTISLGRLIEKKGELNDITNADSLFIELKEKALKLCFPRQVSKYKTEYCNLEKKYNDLEEKYNKLIEK
ncbi:hypothetical protein GKZ28_11875 [Clostridium chromiireducens]|uniref:Type II toxin-antitoxin system PemK/MazF family toxin n=1 Tax=Clostridium chromiireducens TaxID=225345 RepID=A0A964W2L6_9CLOT|nr:type II toxin-antitoxin system PemK/MazF family toxin [Clostridium chromiireducens]MVX64389.1 hypothetical protein [Clostridium chromiireducens]